MVEKYKHDKAFNGGKSLSNTDPGDKSKFGNGKGNLMPGYNEDQGEFATRKSKKLNTGVPESDSDAGRFKK